MSFNLADSVKGLFTGNLISAAATSLGESEGSIQKALTGAIPSIVAGLVSKAGTAEGAAGILNLARQAANSGMFNNLGGFMDNDSSLISKGAEMLKGILGDKAGGVASLLSNFAGIKHSSASSILSMAAPASLSALGKHAADHNLSTAGLMSFLASQKNVVMNVLPSGLSSVAGLLGLGSMGSAVSSATGKATHTVHKTTRYPEDTDEKTSRPIQFLLPLLLAVLVVALGIYFFKGCGNQTRNMAVTTDTTTSKIANAADTGLTNIVNHERALFKVELPNNTVIDAYKGGIEDKLVTFLGTDYKTLGEDSLKKVWFDFDNLNFTTGSADITEESRVQVSNIAAILKAFPSVKLKIGGYTDKVGDEAVNRTLSAARAKSVQAGLSKAGVGKQISGAEGYGSAYAVYAANAPESDRVKDRHVSVSVR